ncbi:MAG: glycosyltransferase family 4 protein [Candidatus Micrarchaeota archaeon]
MQIGIVSLFYPPNILGGSVYVYNLKHALEDLGVDIKLITSSESEEGDVKVKIPKVPGRGLYFQLKCLQSVKDIDIIHSFNTGAFLVPNKPIIEHIHHYDFTKTKCSWIRKQILITKEIFSYKRAVRVTTLSKIAAMDLEKAYGKKRIDIIPCGVQKVYRPQYGDSTKILCAVGSPFLWRKGTEDLIEAFKIVRKRCPNVELYITGEPIWDDEKEKMNVVISKKEDGIHFTGKITKEELQTLYRECGMAVVPSRYEGFGMPILDAMANKKALVTTSVGIANDLKNEDIAIVESGNSLAMSERIIELIENEKLRKRIANNGLEIAKRYTWKNAAKKCKKIYEEVWDKVK